MRTPLFATVLLALIATDAMAQNANTALSALRLIPRPDVKRLARIEARDGAPAPERWHFLIHDPATENGLREYVVAGGDIVAMRALSQFAETVAPGDVIDSGALEVDTDKMAAVAGRYAEANGAQKFVMAYELAKNPATALPVWRITCADEARNRLGEIVFDPATGSVVSHDGFPKKPGGESQKTGTVRNEERPRERRTAVAPPRGTPREIRRAEPVATPPEKRGPTRKIGNSFQRLFGGGR